MQVSVLFSSSFSLYLVVICHNNFLNHVLLSWVYVNCRIRLLYPQIVLFVCNILLLFSSLKGNGLWWYRTGVMVEVGSLRCVAWSRNAVYGNNGFLQHFLHLNTTFGLFLPFHPLCHLNYGAVPFYFILLVINITSWIRKDVY